MAVTVSAKKKGGRPIPWQITLPVGLLPDDLTEKQWTEKVRGIVRKYLRQCQILSTDIAPISYYDQRLWEIILSVMEEN